MAEEFQELQELQEFQELQESEVIFQESEGNDEKDQIRFVGLSNSSSIELGSKNLKRKKKNSGKKMMVSAPVSMPENVAGKTRFQYVESEIFDDEMTPPHLIIGRRLSGNMAFSVCTGIGRTLKGRDLSEVRNSILRMTGFLET